jgi:hypothetical protein
MGENRYTWNQTDGRGVDRRTLLKQGSGAAALAMVMAVTHRRLAGAQAATDLSGLGYPELAITVTDTGFEGVPASTAAGRYLLTAKNTRSAEVENAGAVGFVSPTPAGMSAADFIQFVTSIGSSAATPMAGGDEGGEEEQPLPLFVYQLHFAGGVYAPTGTTAQAVIDLTPGEYVVWGDDPAVPLQPAIVNVTGEFPQDVTDPSADITATLIDFAITIEGNLTAGKHLMKVQHQGAQPHFLDIEKGPDTMTLEQVQAALMGDGMATPAGGGLAEGDLQGVFYSPTQSIGTVTFQQLELTAGNFLAACFFPTAGTGVPHAMNGMIDVFTVTG